MYQLWETHLHQWRRHKVWINSSKCFFRQSLSTALFDQWDQLDLPSSRMGAMLESLDLSLVLANVAGKLNGTQAGQATGNQTLFLVEPCSESTRGGRTSPFGCLSSYMLLQFVVLFGNGPSSVKPVAVLLSPADSLLLLCVTVWCHHVNKSEYSHHPRLFLSILKSGWVIFLD